MSSPSPLQVTGLYAPIKDLVNWILKRRRRGLRAVNCEVQQLGETTWLLVTVQCKKGAVKPVVVRSARVERYEKAFDSCAEPEPVPERTVRLAPSGAVTVKPGEGPTRWEARFLTEHLRRSALKGEDAATAREMGSHVLEAKYEWRRAEAARASSDRVLVRLLGALAGPQRVKLRVVLDLQDLKPVQSEPFEVPPPSPLGERLLAAVKAK